MDTVGPLRYNVERSSLFGEFERPDVHFGIHGSIYKTMIISSCAQFQNTYSMPKNKSKRLNHNDITPSNIKPIQNPPYQPVYSLIVSG